MISARWEDLSRCLSVFDKPTRAADFWPIMGASSIYSRSIESNYTTYNVRLDTHDEPTLVIEPDRYEFASLYQGLSYAVIKETSIYLMERHG